MVVPNRVQLAFTSLFVIHKLILLPEIYIQLQIASCGWVSQGGGVGERRGLKHLMVLHIASCGWVGQGEGLWRGGVLNI